MRASSPLGSRIDQVARKSTRSTCQSFPKRVVGGLLCKLARRLYRVLRMEYRRNCYLRCIFALCDGVVNLFVPRQSERYGALDHGERRDDALIHCKHPDSRNHGPIRSLHRSRRREPAGSFRAAEIQWLF